MTKFTPENTAAVGRPVKVFCGGVEILHAVEADDVDGYVVFMEADEDGRIKTVSDCIQYGRVSGVVEVSDA